MKDNRDHTGLDWQVDITGHPLRGTLTLNGIPAYDRDELARVLEQAVQEGLDGSRDLDVALDAMAEAFRQYGDTYANRQSTDSGRDMPELRGSGVHGHAGEPATTGIGAALMGWARGIVRSGRR